MADCKEQIYSNDYYDFIIPFGEQTIIPALGSCVQRVDEEYDILFYARDALPPLRLENFAYNIIPKCYGLLDQTALEVSGIIRMQNQPTLALKGEGVLIGFLDTGERVIIMLS